MLYRTYILLTWRFSSTKLCLRPGLRVFQQPASMAWITLARCTRGTGAVRDRTNRAISSLSSWDSSRKRNFLGISSSHNLPTMGVVIPYLLAETTTKSLGEQRMDLTHVMATLLQLKEEELTHRVGSFYSDHCLVPL